MAKVILKSLRRLVKLEWLAVALAAPALIFPDVSPVATGIALVTLVILWLVRWGVCGQPWPVTPLNGALFLFVVMIPVGIWASAMPELTRPKATGLILGLAVFRVVALTVRSTRIFSWALVVGFLLGGGIIGVGLLSVQWPAKMGGLETLTQYLPRLIESLPGLRSSGVSPNQLAGVLTFYLPWAAALVIGLFHSQNRAPISMLVGSVIFLVGAAFALLLTQSRGGWIGGLAGLLALGTLWGLTATRRWAQGVGLSLPMLAVVATLGILLYVGPQRVGELVFGATEGSVETAVGSISIQGRIEIWSRAVYALQDFPFTGCGLGAFRRVVHILYPLFTIPPDHDIAHAHNIFLQTALDLGYPGLIGYLAILGLAGFTCWRAAQRAARQGAVLVQAAALGLVGGLVGLHVYGLADALALGSKPAVAFWFVLGLIAALPRVIERERRAAEP